jgi:hypothetical protein
MSSNRGHKRKKPQTTGGDPAAPSQDEWAKMTPYGRFIGIISCYTHCQPPNQRSQSYRSRRARSYLLPRRHVRIYAIEVSRYSKPWLRAAVLPGGTKVGTELPTYKYWLVRILAIRGRPLPTKKRPRSQAQVRVVIKCIPLFSTYLYPQAPEIWVEVNWFYSPTEVSYKLEGL